MTDRELQAHEAVRRRSWTRAVTLYDQVLTQLSTTTANACNNNNSGNSQTTTANVIFNTAENNVLPQTPKERQITCLLGRAESLLELGRYESCLDDARNVLFLLVDQNDCLASLARARRWHVHALVKLKKYTEAEQVIREWIGALGAQQSFSDICKTLERYKSLIQLMSGQKSTQKPPQGRLDDEMSILDTKLDHWATNNLPLDKYSKLLSNKGLKKREAAAAAAAVAAATTMNNSKQDSTSASSASSVSSASSTASSVSSSSSSSTSASSPAASSPSANNVQQNGNNSDTCSISASASVAGSTTNSKNVVSGVRASASDSSLSNALSFHGNESVHSNNSPEFSVAHVSASSSQSSLSSATQNLVKTLEQLSFLQSESEKDPSEASSVADFPAGAGAGAATGLGSGADSGNADDETEEKIDASDTEIKCTYCAITFFSAHELNQHCQTESHQNMIMSDEGRDWKWRPPPRGFTLDTYSLCEAYSESQCCQYGNQCVEAHGQEELNEWNERFEYRRMRLQKACEKELFGKSYTEQILERWIQATAPERIMCEKVEDVIVKCEQELVTTISSKSSKREWVFLLQAQHPLKAVALLHDAHRHHFTLKSINAINMQGNLLQVELKCNQEWVSPAFSSFSRKSKTSSDEQNQSTDNSAGNAENEAMLEHQWQVTIEFRTEIYGTFRQAVCFDIGQEPRLVRNVCVDVVPVSDVEKLEVIKRDIISNTAARWDVSNTQLYKYETNVPDHQKTEAFLQDMRHEREMLERYPCPRAHNFTLTQSTIVEKRLTPNNYRARTHELLFVEEIARYEQIARFNVRTKLNVTSNYILTPAGMATSTAKYSLAGELFALMQLSKDISEDTSAGRLILSNCMSVYISLPENENERETREKEGKRRAVYEALIEDKGKNEIYLKLSAKCVEMMGLKSDTDIEVDVQFQLNRLPYCEWHSAVDKITDFKIIFPTTELDTSIPWTPKKQWSDTAEPKLNAKQREAVNAITANMAVKLPPILLIGPFGTGKTYTLAQAIKQLLLQEDAKILICTHSNSAADLYIKEYLHPWIEEGLTEATPLRVYYHKRWVATVNSIVKQYCITDGNGSFRRPSMEDIMKYRIVVVTLSISMELATIGLPKGYFTHIFLDEAAQAMECEAIMPLALANDSTRIVLAGDHMQMSPELFSAFAMERKLHISLLERLYSHYPSNFASKILLCENYRAHEAIIRFTSELFYEQKLISSGKQPRHERFYPLTFFTTRGEDVQDKNSTAFYNNAEVYELVERVSELRKKWPSSWGKMNDGSIGIMTPYADQVFRIRSELRKRRMGGISVERVLNVQGKQFRAVFLSTVRTRRTCLPSGGLGGVQASTGASNANEDTDYGFLSNSKLLNTAITRAQSLVAVVGDPVALCSIGRCRKVWERFIEICDENKSLFGITWSYLRSQLDGVELKRGYVLNPLAPEFVPRALQPEAYLREQAAMYMLSGHSTPGSHHPLSGSPAVGTPTHHVHMPPPPGAIGPPPNGPPHGVMMYGHGPQMHNNLSNASGTGLNVHGQPAGPQNSQSAQQQQQVSQMMHPALAAAFNAAMVMMNQPPPSTGGKNNGGGNANGNNFNPPVPPNANNHMLGMRGNAQQVVPPTAAQQPFMGVRGGQQNSGPGGPSGVAPPPPPPGQYSQYMAWQQAAAAQQQQQMRGGNTVAVNATNSNQGGAQNINSSLWGPPPQNNPWSVLPQNKSVPPQVATASVASNTRQQQPTQVPQTSVAAIQQQRCGSVQANALVQQQQQQQTAAANYQKKPTLYGAVGGVGGAVLPSGPQQQVAPPHGNFGVGGFNQMQMLNVHGRGGHMPNGPISPMDPFMSRLPGAGVGPIGQQAPPPGLTQPQVPPQQQQAQQQQGSKDFQAYANNNNNNMQLNSSGNNNNSNNNNNIGGNNNLFSNLLPLPVNGGGSGVSTGGNNNNNVSNNNNNNNNNTMNKQQSPTVSRYSQAQEYAMLLPPNMSIYEMAFEPKENQYNWYLKVLEMHGQEAANKFTEMLRHTMNNLIHHPLQPQQQQLPHILAAQQQQLAAIKPPLQPGVTPQQQQHQQLNQLLSQRNNDMLQTPSPQMLNTAAQQQHARGVNGGTGVGGGPYMNPLAGIVGNPASALLPLQQLAMNNSISGLDDSLTPLMADAAVGAGVNFNQQIDLVFNSLMNGIEMSQPILRDLLGMLGTGGATGGSGGTTGGNGVTPTTVNHIQTSSNGPDAMHVNHQQQQQQHHHQQQQQLFHQQQQLLQQQQRQQQQQQQAQQQAAVHSKMFPLINNSLQQQQAGNTQQQLISTSLNYFAAPTSQQPQQQQLTKSQQQLMRNQQQNGQQQQTQALTSPLQQQQQQQQQQPSGTTTTPTFIGSPLLRQHEILLCDFGNMPGSGTSVPLYRRQAVGGSASQPSANNNNNSNNLGLNIGCDFASNNSLFSSGANAGGTNKNNLSPHESNAANNILVGIGGTGNLIEALFQSNNADKSTTNTTNVVNNELQQQQQQNATNNFTNIYGNYKPLNSDLDIFLRDHNNHFVGGNTAPVVASTVTTTPSVLVTNTITTQRAAGTTPNVTTTTQQPQQQGGGYASVLTTPTATYAAVLSQGSHNHSHHGQTHMPHSHTTRVPPTTATSAAGNNKSSEQHQHQQQQQQQYHQQQQHVHHKQQQQQKTVAIDANKIANKELKNKSNNNNNNKNSQTNNMEAVETDKDPYATIRELGQGTNGYYNYFQ